MGLFDFLSDLQKESAHRYYPSNAKMITYSAGYRYFICELDYENLRAQVSLGSKDSSPSPKYWTELRYDSEYKVYYIKAPEWLFSGSWVRLDNFEKIE